MTYVLGVDGGASKTIALVATSEGEIVGSGRRGGSSIYEGEPAAMLANAVDACHDALMMAGITASEVSSSVFSMSGADWPEDFALIRETFAGHGLGRRITVVNDAVGGLRAGSATGPAVAVICGTGAGTAARGEDGRIWHSSFWQGGGGAVDLTRQGLRAVYRAELGTAPPTALTGAVLDYTGFETVEALLHHLTARGSVPVLRYAGFARVLLDIAMDGDSVAREIVSAFGRELGDDALAGARQVGITHLPFTLVLGGSVFKHPEPLLAGALTARVREVAPAVTVVRSTFEPVVGALQLAFDEVGTSAATSAAIARSWEVHRDRVLAIPSPSTDASGTR